MPVGPNGEALPYGDDPLAALMGGEQQSQPQDSAEYVQELLSLIDEWRQAEQDPEDLLTLEKISTMLQQVITGRAKEAQQAMAGKMSPRLMAQAYGQ